MPSVPAILELPIYIVTKPETQNGEDLFFAVVTDPGIFVKLTVFSVNRNKYIYYDFSNNTWTDSSTESFTLYDQNSHYSVLGDLRFLKVRIPHRFFNKPDFVYILAEDSTDPDKNYETTIVYGEAVTLQAGIINVYGQVFDFAGNPMPYEVVTFQAISETVYYDNPLYTSLSVIVNTDNNGRFSVNLNRNYDYLISVPRMSFSKILRLKNIPLSTSSVSVCIGEREC